MTMAYKLSNAERERSRKQFAMMVLIMLTEGAEKQGKLSVKQRQVVARAAAAAEYLKGKAKKWKTNDTKVLRQYRPYEKAILQALKNIEP